jgi:glycosyltransferase involved in cell wall biosynthesis
MGAVASLNRRPVASVLIPCFNAVATLGAAVQSALEQGDVSVEIVFMDDGSTDNSLAIARRFEPAVRVISGPNQGVSAARNRGIAETAGEWIVFLDADDQLVPGTLRRRLETVEASGADVVVCDWQELLGPGEAAPKGETRTVDMNALSIDAEIACATNFWATTAALMYRRSLVKKIGGFRDDLPVIQDARFLFDAAYHGARFAHSPHVGGHYRVLPQSLSRRDPTRFWRDALLNGKQIEALWRRRGELSPKQLAALSDIYNGAAHGLFRGFDPSFREALAALRASGLSVGCCNRAAELLSDIAGHRGALQIVQCWSHSRRAVSRVRRCTPMSRSVLSG